MDWYRSYFKDQSIHVVVFFFLFLGCEFIEFWWQIKLLKHPSLELFIREDMRRELGGIKINVKEQRSIKK